MSPRRTIDTPGSDAAITRGALAGFGDSNHTGATAMDTPSPAYRAGFAMGVRHALTGDPADLSDARILPLERERDDAARSYDLRPLGDPNFHRGYDDGYDAAMAPQSDEGKDYR